jgi:hypothetical protein
MTTAEKKRRHHKTPSHDVIAPNHPSHRYANSDQIPDLILIPTRQTKQVRISWKTSTSSFPEIQASMRASRPTSRSMPLCVGLKVEEPNRGMSGGADGTASHVNRAAVEMGKNRFPDESKT